VDAGAVITSRQCAPTRENGGSQWADQLIFDVAPSGFGRSLAPTIIKTERQ
jgi:hypothetical protein